MDGMSSRVAPVAVPLPVVAMLSVGNAQRTIEIVLTQFQNLR